MSTIISHAILMRSLQFALLTSFCEKCNQ